MVGVEDRDVAEHRSATLWREALVHPAVGQAPDDPGRAAVDLFPAQRQVLVRQREVVPDHDGVGAGALTAETPELDVKGVVGERKVAFDLHGDAGDLVVAALVTHD